MNRIIQCSICFLLAANIVVYAQQKVQFPSSDGIMITADLYEVDRQHTYIVLCHLAGHSRGEYVETAKRLNAEGFNCLALDARSGNEVFGVKNETAMAAREKGKPTEYLDAEKDIISAIDYAYKRAGSKKVILLGSSYSASLALKIGTTNPKVNAVASFSPGEHFGNELNLKKEIASFNKPLFVTSSLEESAEVKSLIKDIKSKTVTQFTPNGEGAHGSIALWKTVPENPQYWTALLNFLKQYSK